MVYVSDKVAFANSVDPYQLMKLPDQGLHCLSFHQVFCETNAQNAKYRQKKKNV